MKKTLITGATGQVGSELVIALREKFGGENIIAVGHSTAPNKDILETGPYETVDAIDIKALESLIEKYDVGTVYHLVGILSAHGEKKPDLAWKVNMDSLKNVLDLARDKGLRVFWPSSIAAFGPTTPRQNTPQKTVLEPSTIYGVTKVSGELLANYYFLKYGVDVRSLRYPGLISYKTPPGGGTSDYAVEIFIGAVKDKHYTCFVGPETVLPMMYMPDAVKATIDIMDADFENLTVHTSYNLASMSFAVEDLAEEIKKHIPEFTIDYKPDERQKIADSWPKVIDDSQARKDWGWQPEYNLSRMVVDMLRNIDTLIR